MRIALVNPPFSKLVYGNEYTIKGVTPALGLFYLQSIAQDVAEVEVFEGEFAASLDTFVQQINDYAPDILGITTNTSTYPYCKYIAKSVSAKLKVAGGPYATFRIEECLEDFDAVFLGDAEMPLRDLALEKSLETIPGIAFRKPDGSTVNTGNPILPPLDSIPFPDHDRLQQGLYRASPHRELGGPFATMMTTRGCGFRCTFCLSAQNGMNGGRYRERSVTNVMEEVRLLTDKYGIESIQFWDDTFTMRKERTRQLCKELATTGISYVCNTRTDKIDSETADLLATSGCRSVFFGVESGNETILADAMKKDVRNDQVRNAVVNCKKAGLRVTNSFIFGAIDDDEDSIKETVQFALTLDSDFVLFNIYTAHPGTEGYKRAIQAGLIDHYRVDIDRYLGEPVGVPTICRSLNRKDLQRLKAEAYVQYYLQRDPVQYANIIEAYRAEVVRLT